MNPIVNHLGETAGVSFFARNINQRKLAELKIKSSEEAYKLLLETINDGVMFIDNDNIIRFANRKFTEITGYRDEELNGINFTSLLSETDPLHRANIVQSILTDEDAREISMVNQQGTPVWFSVKGTPLMDDAGRIGGALLTHTEITHRKQAEKAIREKEQDYSNLLETMNEGLIYLDRAGVLKFANKKFETLTGFHVSDLLGNKLPSQISGGEQQRVAVARALINRPTLLLADEPTGNLDNKNAETLYALFVELKAVWQQRIIMVTHNEKLTSHSDQVIYLNSGRIE